MNKISLALIGLSAVLFPLFTYLFVDANFPYLHNLYSGFATDQRSITTLIYTIFIILFFSVYLYFLKQGKDLDVRKFVLMIILLLLFSYPAILSYDIFNYIATSKVLFSYHENPYIVMPIEFLDDPVLMFTRAANKVALYGPLWILLSGIPYLFSFGNYLVSIFAFKIFLAIFYGGAVFLIQKITKNYLSILLFAANPLVIIETFVSGHNDIVMMSFALLAFYLLKKKKLFLAFFFLLMSVLIKYATLFLIPVFIYAAFHTIKNRKLNWDRIYFYCFLSMLFVFLLSIFREEIYPWYAIWPLTLLVLIPQKNRLIYLYVGLTFGLMLSYIPYMYFGTYSDPTPLIKILLTLLPPACAFLYQVVKVNKKSIL